MIKLSLCLVAIALGAEVSLAGSVGLHEKSHIGGKEIGSSTGNCSALSGLLPNPQSGCCGRHAGQEKDTKGDMENNIDHRNADNDTNENNEINHDIENSDSDHGILNDDKNRNSNCGGSECTNIGGIINDVVSDVFDNIQNAILKWIPKFQNWKAQLSRKPRSREFMSLHGENFISNEITNDYSSNSPDVVGLIAEGKQAGLRQYPWLVHFLIKQRSILYITQLSCGGSLISPRFVLTAAHCVNFKYNSYDDIDIYLAEYDISTSPDCVGNTCIENMLMHPENIIMHEAFESSTLDNDIALMRLRGSAPYTEYIRPICLPPFNIDVPQNGGTPLEVAGWGHTGHGASPIKQSAQIQLVAQRQCYQYYSYLTPGKICAVGGTGQNVCSGDSGGPLMMEKDGSFYLVGIISGISVFSSCGDAVPAIYTNVYTHLNWIHKNMS